MTFKLLLVLAASISATIAYSFPDLPPGPYCGTNNLCCPNREDRCSHFIRAGPEDKEGTMCYCDYFCNRTTALMSENNDDCCPDYPSVCLGIDAPPELKIKTCEYNGREYNPSATVKQNCNTCICLLDSDTDEAVWECESYVCIISDDVLLEVDISQHNWEPDNYTKFYGEKLKQGLKYYLGTDELSPTTKRMNAITYETYEQIPRHFDAREKWPGFISPVRDQGQCGADWAVSVTTVASDRFAIQSNGAEKVILSPQTLLSCNERYQRGCDGGHIDAAWIYVLRHGIVDEDCFPYKAQRTRCPFSSMDNVTLIQDGCRPVVPQRTSRYRVGPPSRLKKEKDIMYDIMKAGPVQATMTVYQDFFHYRRGIYRHTNYGDGQSRGLHSVRVVGWGEERGEKYWIVANSWGTEWGENGYFRILRGSNESGIESFVLTVLTEVTEAYNRRG